MNSGENITDKNQKKPSFISWTFVLLFLAHFITVTVYFLFMTTMARHAVQAFACSDSVAGFVASIFLVGAAVARIAAGRYADVFGLKRCSFAALILMLACCLLYPIADTSLPLMMIVRFVHGMSFGVANTTMPALATEIIPLEVMAEGTGWFMLSNSLGTGVGPLLGLLVAGGFEYSTLFTVCSVLSVVAIASTLPIKAGMRPGEGTRNALKRLPKFKITSVLDPASRKFSVYMFIVAFAYSGINAFVDPYSATIGLDGVAPFLFLLYSVSLVFLRPPVGRLQDRKGENVVLYPSIASMAIAMLLCASCSFTHNPIALVCVGFFIATGFGTCMSAGLGVIGRMTGGKKAAAGIATFYLLCDFGCGIGPLVLGIFVGTFGYVGMYIACTVVSLLGVVYYHFAHGRHVKRNAQ